MRSAIGLPAKSTNVLKALGLRKRMATVFHPVSPAVAGQIMKVKELVAVKEVEKALTKQEVHQERVPDPGYYIESRAQGRLSCAEQGPPRVKQLSKADLLSLNADRSV
jgi:large subunit ribosomal protein L30